MLHADHKETIKVLQKNRRTDASLDELSNTNGFKVKASLTTKNGIDAGAELEAPPAAKGYESNRFESTKYDSKTFNYFMKAALNQGSEDGKSRANNISQDPGKSNT